MSHQNITVSESMQLHEMLNFKTLCMTKSKLIQGLVFDKDLKDLMEKDVQQSIKAVALVQGMLKESPTLQ